MSFLATHGQCVTDNTVPNCSIYSSSITGNDVKCVKCKDGYVPAYGTIATS